MAASFRVRIRLGGFRHVIRRIHAAGYVPTIGAEYADDSACLFRRPFGGVEPTLFKAGDLFLGGGTAVIGDGSLFGGRAALEAGKQGRGVVRRHGKDILPLVSVVIDKSDYGIDIVRRLCARGDGVSGLYGDGLFCGEVEVREFFEPGFESVQSF